MDDASLKKLVIFGDPKKGHVTEAVADFSQYIRGKARIVADCHIDQCSIEVLDKADFAVVFGGDGSIISAARSLSESNVPVIGVNLGKLGYLAEFSVEELKQYIDSILSGNFRTEKRMMLKCSVVSGGKETFSSKAVNDVFVMAGAEFRMIELGLRLMASRWLIALATA